MARVIFWGSLKPVTGGDVTHEIDAATIRQLLDELSQRFPALAEEFENQVSISIDGLLYNDDWFRHIEPDAEIYILPRIEGG